MDAHPTAPRRWSWWLLALWLALLALLAAEWWIAWHHQAELKALMGKVQKLYWSGKRAPWILRADGYLHLLTTIVVALWAGLGCRLITPRSLAWMPLLITVSIAFSDEIMQLNERSRSFETGDMAWDAIGTVVGCGLCWAIFGAGRAWRQTPARSPQGALSAAASS